MNRTEASNDATCSSPMTPAISVIVPVLNEEPFVGMTLDSALAPSVERIVVDGGSFDRTMSVAREHGAAVISSNRGRAQQMNAGARVARAPVLLFLHADTLLPAGFAERVHDVLTEPGVAVGAFRFGFDASGLCARAFEGLVDWRSRLLGLPYGDQALFMMRTTFDALDGFAPLPLMEDVDLVRRARRLGRIACADAAVMTSARRWWSRGFLAATLSNQACLLAWLAGVPAARIARWRGHNVIERRAPVPGQHQSGSGSA